MTEFDANTIYRQYAAAYARCNEIEQSLRDLEAKNPGFVGMIREHSMLRSDGEDAYFELLQMHHKLCMCISLDIAAVRAKLQKCGVFVGDDEEEEEDGKTIPTELEL